MRILITIDDACTDLLLSTKSGDGRFIFVTREGRGCEAKVIGQAIPDAFAGNGGTYKALYTIVMLEEMDGSLTDADRLLGK